MTFLETGEGNFGNSQGKVEVMSGRVVEVGDPVGRERRDNAFQAPRGVVLSAPSHQYHVADVVSERNQRDKNQYYGYCKIRDG
jgi:hypothetical protein